VVEHALAAGHEVVVFARNPDKLGKLTERVAVVKGELTDEAAIESVLLEVEAVVSLLGPTSGKVTGTPVADGAGRILEAMQRVGVRRIVAISTPSSPDPMDSFDPLVWFPKMLVKLLVPAGLHDIRKGWAIALWAVQLLLAAMFLLAGVMKSTQPIEQLVSSLPWVANVPRGLVRFIGISELAGGLGLILPAATRILPVLTPIAALGLVTIMVLASGYHAMHGEFAAIAFNAVLGLLAAFVAWGRFTKAPVTPRR
jgi:uncharacterized membrane protein